MSIHTYLNFHLHRFAHARFKEPILVFESDDWGKVARKADGIYPPEFGKRTDWSHDQLETEAELESLYLLLESFKNDFERTPVFTANFIVSNPDIEKTTADNYQQLHLKTIDADFPHLHKKWLEGIKRGVIFPQYHGRLHYNAEKYLEALQTDEKTRFLFEQGINGGMENFEATNYALYSECFRTDNSTQVKGLETWLKHGLADFERIFGFKSASMIAPNYVFHPNNFNALTNAGIKFLQAGNKILFTEKGIEQNRNYCQGYQHNNGLTILARNHKLEPNRNKKEWKADFSIRSAKIWFQRGVPAVIDTHRFNYVSKFAENSRQELRTFLEGMREIKGLRILTTPELGEAFTNNGAYTDVFSGEQKKLTPRDSWFRKLARSKIS